MALRPPSRHTLLAIACMCHTYAALLSSISHLSLQLKSAKSFTVHSKSIVPSARYHRRAKLNLRNCSVSRLASATEGDDANTSSSNSGHGIDLSENPNLVGVTLPRAPGVEWGTDLSFSFVYIREIDPSGAAAASGLVEKGDQLCAVGDSNVIGLPFDAVMTIIASLKGKTMDLVLFRGTKEELIAACSNKDEYEGGGKADTIKITVIVDPGDGKGGKAKRKEIRELIVPKGSNVREVLTENVSLSVLLNIKLRKEFSTFLIIILRVSMCISP
uniref:PDZ domain-containing protein n=1 Tax=Corethron hystrix TaxID=216773 RepID=A0A7S1C089_9STRA|mmetsp:Transcript_9073/g.20056  ORF Transcript_9073/g.20056 Transcript_9073/m.20056 type:complete len:273 (+) Transcript_9073:159-977(+)